ncbi:hypothetical protein HPB48_022181 [Haemaphysalis longicornis]|uniref:Uncharacterized protein n=1 Tax=Haemaphysalis longicornis TaxID=44386 RepID=A0A9J6G299_HAELO|nr:hypothetical protein HPB48_022181 [Haemaphysalis longicornis]
MGKNSGKGACKDANKDTGRDGEKGVTDVKELRDLLKMFDDFKKDFRAEMRELKDGISFCCTDICNDVKDTATVLKNLRLEMQELLRQNIKLRKENKRLSERCDELEQYQRLNNLQVKGAPAESDPVTALQKIGEAVGETIDATDIDICHWDSTPKVENKPVGCCPQPRRGRVDEKPTVLHSDVVAQLPENVCVAMGCSSFIPPTILYGPHPRQVLGVKQVVQAFLSPALPHQHLAKGRRSKTVSASTNPCLALALLSCILFQVTCLLDGYGYVLKKIKPASQPC